MGLLDIFRTKKPIKEKVEDILAYGTGRYVYRSTPELFNSALWACVINLARIYATMPWHGYKKDSNGNRKAEEGTVLAELLKKPNPYMTSYEFRFVMGYNFEMHGEAPAIIKRSRQGRPIALYPVSPHALVGYWEGTTLYYVLAPTGERFSMDDVLLIRNTPMGYGAGSVLSPIYYAKNDIELAQKCKAMQAEYYQGATVIGHTISVPQNFTDEQKDKIRQQFNSGAGFRNYVLDERIKITPIQIEDADISKLASAQEWDAKEVARRFNVPPFFIGDTTGTYANSEQQGMQMVIYCLQPRVTAWEAALNDALCQSNEYVKFSFEGLLRGDHSTRASFYQSAIANGWMTINEVRKKEELPSIGSDGDVFFFPMNYGNLHDVVAGKYSNGSNGYGSIWNMPAEEKKETPRLTLREEKRRHDLRYVAEAQAPVKSNRQKIESLIRKQLKASIEKIQACIATGSPARTVIEQFEEWFDENAKGLSAQYKAIYLDVLKKMVPIVRDETGKDDEIGEDRLESFAGAYSDSLTKRVNTTFENVVKGNIETEELDDAMEELLTEYPIEQGEEEVNRSSNAFSLFLFQQLHVSVFHVVAAADACSFCSTLDGKVASVEGYVVRKGEDVDTGEEVRHISKDYRHPPFHSHCRCSIAPGE